MAQTYCAREDIEDILGIPSVLACIDDDQDGVESVEETALVAKAIERAAVEINSSLRHQYILSQLASNSWCKWANAYLAAYHLRCRRANPVEQSVADAVVDIRSELKEMRWGRQQLPEQAPSFEHIPTVSNFKPELYKSSNPIRVVPEESTGVAPVPGRKRNPSDQNGYY